MTALALSLTLLVAGCASRKEPNTLPPKAETEVDLEQPAPDVDPDAKPLPTEILDEQAEEALQHGEEEEPGAKPMPGEDDGPAEPEPLPRH